MTIKRPAQDTLEGPYQKIGRTNEWMLEEFLEMVDNCKKNGPKKEVGVRDINAHKNRSVIERGCHNPSLTIFIDIMMSYPATSAVFDSSPLRTTTSTPVTSTERHQDRIITTSPAKHLYDRLAAIFGG